jgi:ribosomal protein S27E
MFQLNSSSPSQTYALVLAPALTKIRHFYFVISPSAAPPLCQPKNHLTGTQRKDFFQKAESPFCPSAQPPFSHFTDSSTCCGTALTDFKYEVNMKNRQLLLFKAEAKTSVSCPRCGTALTYLKN